MKNKVIVTGATGFLGNYVIKELLTHDYQVVALGRNQDILTKLANQYKLETLALDLANASQVSQMWPAGAAFCIHVAALSTVYGPYQDFYQANVLATQHAIEAAIASGVKRFVFVSSPSIYAKCADDFNISEGQVNLEIKEKKYLNNYIRSKVEGERLLKDYEDQIEIVVIRPRGLFGVGDTSIFPRLMEVNQKIGVPLFRKGQGNQMDLTCVENVAYALRLCLEAPAVHQQTFNITNGEPVEFKALMTRVFDLLEEDLSFRPLNERIIYRLAGLIEGYHTFFKLKKEPLLTRYTVSLLAYSQTLDISAAKEQLGYEPQMTIDQGVKHYLNTIKADRNE